MTSQWKKAGTNPQQLYPFSYAGHGKKQMNSWQSDKDPYWVTFVTNKVATTTSHHTNT
jgi:hypothetical protein